MSDLIWRQDAIDEIQEVYEREFPTASGAFDEFVISIIPNILRNLPSVEPEQKKGHWVPVTNGRGGFECDQCHNYSPSYQNGDEYLSYYCPNCGADMRGEQ